MIAQLMMVGEERMQPIPPPVVEVLLIIVQSIIVGLESMQLIPPPPVALLGATLAAFPLIVQSVIVGEQSRQSIPPPQPPALLLLIVQLVIVGDA